MKRGLWIAVACVLLFVFLGLDASAQGLVSGEEIGTDIGREVNVGFFYSKGYHEIDDSGRYSGFGYDLIEELKIYTGWKVNYVGYDKTWPEMLEMLYNGEIDILTDANYSTVRGRKYLFSDYDMGSTYFMLTKRPNDNRFTAESIENFNGARIGVLSGSVASEKLLSFSKENSFTYNIIFFDDEEALKSALLDKKTIDLALSTNFRIINGEEIVYTFGDEYNYIITNKNSRDLMNEIDIGLSSIKLLEPDFFTKLSNKYFMNSQEDSIGYNLREKNYIENNSDRTFKAYISGNLYPFSYHKDSELSGIIPEFFDYIVEATELNVEVVDKLTADNPVTALQTGEIDIWVDSISEFNFGNDFDVRLSVPLIQFTMGILKEKKYGGDLERLGAVFGVEEAINDIDKVYTNLDDALLGIAKGEVDGVIVPVYTAQHIKEIGGNAYEFVPMEGNRLSGMSMAFAGDRDVLLSGIFSKSLLSLPDTIFSELVSKHLDTKRSKLTFDELYERLPWFPWVFAILVMSIISMLVILLYKSYVSRREHELSVDNLSYFKSVISGNQLVIKIEYDRTGKKNCYMYFIDDSYENGIREFKVEDAAILENRNRIHPDDRSIFDEIMSDDFLLKLVSGNSAYYTELRSINSSGVYGVYAVSIDTMPQIGNTDRILILIKDITMAKLEEEEKRTTLTLALENAQKYSDSKTIFLSQMSHDIRTPLNAIMGMTSLAEMNIDDKNKVLECLGIVRDSSSHLLSLVNDILDTSKIEKGQLRFTYSYMSISDVFEKAVNMHSERMRNNNISLKVVHIVKNNIVFCDENRLLQAFSNIISNAVKYTNSGGSIEVSLKESDAFNNGTRFYEFSVSDTGIGMDESILKSIFEPFTRAKEAEFTEGSGLGMSITKSIVDNLGGVIKVDSKVNVGTTVTVSLSFTDNAGGEEQIAEKNEKKPPIKKTHNGKRALLVEDVEINAMFAEALCEMKGLICDVAVNGKEAVDKLEESGDEYYSIVLMDIQMPVMNGYDATRVIRKSHREYLRTIPIIAMSANAFEEDILKCKECGMDDHLAKPVDVHRFSEIVDKYVKE